MKLYRLKFTLTEPSEGTEDKYLAEVPDLPGCRAWGDTAAQAVENLQSVAVAFMESCRDHGDVLLQRRLGNEWQPPSLAGTPVSA